MNKVYIVGVGADGATSLTPAALDLIDQADLLLGGKRLLDLFPESPTHKSSVGNNPAETAALIEANLGKKIVVLASGDPNFYGIARYLVGKLGKEVVEIIPNVSAMQLAFAQVKENWDDSTLLSVHGRPIAEIVARVRASRKVGIFTDDENTPAAIAQVLLAHGIADYRAFVCENLGSTDERIVETDLTELCNLAAAPLNVLILIHELEPETDQQALWHFGIPDDEFDQRRPQRGLITKMEVRMVSLAKLRLTRESVVWDIGAGSGSVSIEAARLASQGRVYAIERNAEDVANIESNVQKFGTRNVVVVHGTAPEALDALPDPSAVFIGGSGGQMEDILAVACRRLKMGGSMVVNLATLENLAATVEALRAREFAADVTLVNVARSKGITNLTRLEPLDPIFVVAAYRKEEAG